MRSVVGIAIVAVCCITVITTVAIVMGHNSALIAASISTISGIAAAVGAYNASKVKYPKWHDERVKKEEELKKGGD